MRRMITYGVTNDGMVCSRYGDEIAFPVLEYNKMSPDNNFRTYYHLEKDILFSLCGLFYLKWTKKIPIKIKNLHRKYWGLKPLKGKINV